MKYTINTDVLPEAKELQNLFEQTSWAKDRSLETIRVLLQNTTVLWL
ncbi:hypothetical protein [Aquimarina sp. SS2-1]